MSTSVVNPLTAPAAGASYPASTGSSTNASSADSLSTEFLQLLIAQLQNQDPENPTDGTEFVTQLAQFTSVQQETQSTTDLNSILSLLQQSAGAASSGTPSNAPSPAAGSGRAAPS